MEHLSQMQLPGFVKYLVDLRKHNLFYIGHPEDAVSKSYKTVAGHQQPICPRKNI